MDFSELLNENFNRDNLKFQWIYIVLSSVKCKLHILFLT